MQFKQALETLEKNTEFKNWKKQNKDCFLAHGFIMLDDLNRDIWQFGFYDKKTDKITTFFVEKDDVRISSESEIFKKPGAKVNRLDTKKINIDLRDALEITDKLQREKYKTQEPMKIFLILQKIDIGQVWNTTMITKAFCTLNVKINSDSGKVLEHKLTSLMEFKAK